MIKKYLIISLLLLFAIPPASHSQTLSFNRVLMVSSTADTVPAGKTWKIESIMLKEYFVSTSSTCSGGEWTLEIFIDGSDYHVSNYFNTGSSGTTALSGGQSLPFWLPEGTTLATRCASSLLSVIEFNVVP